MDAVIFELGPRLWALDLSAVQEVISIGPITPVPAAPRAMVGAVNVRGQVAAVLQLAPLLDRLLGGSAWPTPRQGQQGILIRREASRSVLFVGRIREVARLQRAQVISTGVLNGLIANILTTSIGILHLIDPQVMLRQVAESMITSAARLEAMVKP